MAVDHEDGDFLDPLRSWDNSEAVSGEVSLQVEITSVSGEAPPQNSAKEWTSFNRILMQKFPVSKMISVSSVSGFIFFFFFWVLFNFNFTN